MGVAGRGVRAVVIAAIAVTAFGQAGAVQDPSDQFFEAVEHPAIAYASRESRDAAARFARRIAAGEVAPTFELPGGVLAGLLRALAVPLESQVAVFSRTSLQAHRIEPAHPRVVYFNDSTVVAAVHGGFVEIAAQDASQGVHFYLVDRGDDGRTRIRESARCLSCHHTNAADGVPGLFTRSIATGPDGRTWPRFGNDTSDHRTPWPERWGGWYVTGRAAATTHEGNTFVEVSREDPAVARRTSLGMASSLTGRIDTPAYLTPYSDVVALLVLQHQTRMMNLLTRIGWAVRLALAERPDQVAAVAAREARELVDYLLFVDEAPLPAPVVGSSGFTEAFAARGPRDPRGRSLRDFDLRRRLFAYPCSYMIYSEVFDALPAEARDAVYLRAWAILSGADKSRRYQTLTLADRTAIVDILRATKPSLPPYFTALL